ncbi:hypothetical protein LV779_37825 [Streptomyces thinghirensis]|nr:hypothetical protein [Streptomyces thinghirensis]
MPKPGARHSGAEAVAVRAAEPGRGGRRADSAGPVVVGRGRAAPPGKKRMIDYPRGDRDGWRRWMPSWKLVSGLCIGFFGSRRPPQASPAPWWASLTSPKIAEAQKQRLLLGRRRPDGRHGR